MNKKVFYFSIAIILIMAITFILFISVSFINKKKLGDSEQTTVLEEKLEITNQFAEMTDNEIYKTATENNQKNNCFFIKDDYSRNLCFEFIAIQNSDLAICQDIEDEDIKKDCLNNIFYQKAESTKNILFCAEILNKKEQKRCFEAFFNESITTETCEKIDTQSADIGTGVWDEFDLKRYCRDMVFLREAINSNDTEVCQKINWNELRAGCFSKLLAIPMNSDDDHDGLKFSDEIIYNTSYDNPDTDGDGYLDGDEVKNGYSPTEKPFF